MILRRFADAFRRQDWFTVAVETLIVVFGVFIGLQVNNWNEAREQAALQATLLERLEEEFLALEPVVAELVVFSQSAQQSTADVVNALRQEAPPTDEAAFRSALGRANWALSVPQAATAYSELVSTGRLADIRNVELRKALIRYGDAHERLERTYPVAASLIFAPDSNYYRAVDWNMDAATWTEEGAIVSYDWELLRASRAEMQSWVTFQYDLAQFAEAELREIRAILAILAEDQT
ncbi:hypothetical protein [Hyphomonas sp.]|uniref:hypothetical protein n=1 Tax=Hyphomonas sp. TaxID=87 RepID=UPI000A40D9CD|nr:hypothetical protein [Hyphomonas sp.]MBA4339783.1 hypothetical protein [Hyphomonas sp.]